MSDKINQSKRLFAIILVSIMLIGVFAPFIQANDIGISKGFDKGLSYTSVVPTKKTTFVNFDEETLTDDYAYLAAIPTAVFNHENTLYSHPLLFYQDRIRTDDNKELSLDAYNGIHYFMEDWVSYCGQLDQMTLINVDETKVNHWKAKEYITIEEDNPYRIAKELALQDWSYSDDAVIAVIKDEFEVPENEVSNLIEGSIPVANTYKKTLSKIKQTNSLSPVSKQFEVGDEYQLIKAEAWWDGALIAGKMVPPGDPDIQLSCKIDDEWIQVVTSSDWNLYMPPGHEFTQSYVYTPGTWRISITDFPTKSDTEGEVFAPRNGIPGVFEIQGSILGLIRKDVTYYVELEMYPGVIVDIPDCPMFGCGNAKFKVSWNNPSLNLGATLIGPSGEAIYSEVDPKKEDYIEFEVKRLGECLPGETYSLSVFTTKDVVTPLDFEIEYSWNQSISKKKGDSLTSATEGAILASAINAPLLYTKPSDLPDETKEVLYELGVENVYIVDIGNHLSDDVNNELNDFADTSTQYNDCKKIYDKIRKISGSNDVVFTSGSNDVVFTTMDTWTSWLATELKPGEEKEGAFYLGPTAFIAAHHGSPVIILENHPRLSSAATWHNEFWRRFSAQRYLKVPSSAEMVFTGRRIYDFLKEYDFDKEGKESIITVAGQYEIGIPWDRIFPGVANSGRFCGTPVDTAYWISRSVFYPAMIYANPALQGKNTYTTGSESSREGLRGLLQPPRFNTLVINKPSRDREFEYPVLCSFVTNEHRFNERASKYWGAKYQCADGLIPGETATLEPIDQGVNLKYTGDAGSYFPDMTVSEVTPFYLEKGGYQTVFSTKFEPVAVNLNQGVILWFHVSHGNQAKGGNTLFWDPSHGFKMTPRIGKFTGAAKEPNPWRGYDWLLGSTYEPDTMSMDIVGFYKFTNIRTLIRPPNGMDHALARKPVREWLVERPILGGLFSRIFTVDNLYDGVTGSLSYSKDATAAKLSFAIDEELENLHSVGFITSICQTSNTYLHLTIIRHGSVFQVQDPWPTSWYSTVWQQSIPRDIILGDTVGEAYAKGISHVGILFLGGGQDGGPQWWWDDAENVVYFGDPNLRIYVPENEYSDKNTWDKPKSLTSNKLSTCKRTTDIYAKISVVNRNNSLNRNTTNCNGCIRKKKEKEIRYKF
jgi:hypothetical protein